MKKLDEVVTIVHIMVFFMLWPIYIIHEHLDDYKAQVLPSTQHDHLQQGLYELMGFQVKETVVASGRFGNQARISFIIVNAIIW